MITEVKFDQYSFLIDCSAESGDDYHCVDWIDWSCIGGFVTDEFDQILDSDEEFMQNESRLFEKYISELLKRELVK